MSEPRVIYVLVSGSLCGGVAVAARHVAGLAERGHAAEFWCVQAPPTWFPGLLPWRRFPNTDALGIELRAATPKIAVATFIDTAWWVHENLRPGDRGYHLIQDFDGETYHGQPALDAKAAALGLTPITEGEWVRRRVRERFGVEPVHVGIGVSDLYQPMDVRRERFRIMTPYRTWSGGPADLKGWKTAIAAAADVCEREPRASLVTFGMEAKPGLPAQIPHIHLQGPSDLKLRELYAEAGVFLSASRHEGFGLPMLEAMACGAPVVCTRAQGNEEFCREGDTALLAEAGDARGLADAILRLMGDEPQAAALGAAGVAEAAKYRWSGVIGRLEAEFFAA